VLPAPFVTATWWAAADDIGGWWAARGSAGPFLFSAAIQPLGEQLQETLPFSVFNLVDVVVADDAMPFRLARVSKPSSNLLGQWASL
jgi:hypothetical protein